jgi:hypothetical protein
VGDTSQGRRSAQSPADPHNVCPLNGPAHDAIAFSDKRRQPLVGLRSDFGDGEQFDVLRRGQRDNSVDGSAGVATAGERLEPVRALEPGGGAFEVITPTKMWSMRTVTR